MVDSSIGVTRSIPKFKIEFDYDGGSELWVRTSKNQGTVYYVGSVKDIEDAMIRAYHKVLNNEL